METLILKILIENNHKWKIDGEYQFPTEQDILAVLDDAAEHLSTAEIGDTYDRGGIFVQKNHRNRFDTYVYVGEYI